MNNTLLYKPKYPVQTLSNALDILIYLKNTPSANGVSIVELSEALDMGKSSVHRLLDTLLAYDFVEKIHNGSSYKLGWGLYNIGNSVIDQHSLNGSNFYPILDKISKKFSETVNLGITNGNDVIIMSKVEPNVKIRANVVIGGCEPLYCTSLGKLFLSQFSVQEVRDYYKNNKIERFTNNTIVTVEDMFEELVTVKNNGYAIDNEEFSIGLICIAMPICDYTGKIVAAISVSGPSERMGELKRNKILPELKEACAELSLFMGYSKKQSI